MHNVKNLHNKNKVQQKTRKELKTGMITKIYNQHTQFLNTIK